MGRRTRSSEARRGTHHWTESEARSALAEHAASGLSALTFCRSKGYSTQRLQYWAKRLGPARSVSFVPVELPAAPRRDGCHDRIEIACGDVVIRVREDLDVAHVARIAVAVSSERARRC